MTETYEYKGYSIPVDLMRKTGGGPETFPQISEFHQALLKQWIGLKPSDVVLEVGCGIGRDAIPLSEYLDTGSYVGIDIIKPSIEWCQNNIASRKDKFQFLHFDIKDDLHNPGGVFDTKDFTLPFSAASFDKIFLFSVFTHMFQPDIEHYLREFRRCLKPEGLIYATTFLYNEEILRSARETNLTVFNLRFEHEIYPGCRVNDPTMPLGAVAFTREVWDGMIKRCGLRYAMPFLRGSWSGYYEEPQEGQDVAILAIDS